VLSVVAMLLAAGCSGGEVTPRPGLTATLPAIPAPSAVFPGERWAQAASGDWTDLDRTLAAEASTCVAVIQGGRLVHEAYFNGGSADAPVKVYSITKSMTSLLVGMAADDGTLSLDDPASEQIDEWRVGPAGDVSVRDLLSMTSGREWSDATDRRLIRQVDDQTAYAVGLRQREERGEWVYDNAAVQTLERVLAESQTEDADVIALARRRLLEPLGMRHTRWPTDRTGQATTYSGVESTCRDLARVGYLVLQGGRWRDDQLVSENYIAQMTAASSARNAGYGLLWWTNAEGRIVEVLRQAGYPRDKAPYEGRLAPRAPADATWAFGHGQQFVAVVPSEDVVAVRLGRRPATPNRITFDSFTRAVLDGLESS